MTEDIRAAVLEAGLPHVTFDGWTDATLAAAIRDSGVDEDRARLAFPRGGLDLLLAYHAARDADVAASLAAAPPTGRFSERMAEAVLRRLELMGGEREAVRRGAALFALPTHAAQGARTVWHTADTLWTALGDQSRDYNWWSKRATLSGVYSTALLYWLGDTEPALATRAFIDRRIGEVMQIEEVKARVRRSPLARALLKGPRRLLDHVKAPADTPRPDLPGSLATGDGPRPD